MSHGVTDIGLPSPDKVREWLRAAAADPASLPDEGYEALLGADGRLLADLCELADSLRQRAVGSALTYVVNRNLDTSAVAGPDPRSRERLAALVAEAHELGATEICMQGPLPVDSDDDYLDLIAAVKAPAPGIHLHAFRPSELLDGAARRGIPLEEFLIAARQAGLGSVPGTAARILDDEVRIQMLGGPDLPVSQWVAVIEAAHRAGLTSTSTMIFGHVETPAHQVAHLRLLAGIQDRTGGFTEFVGLPFVHHSAPIYLAGIARPGPTMRDNRAVHAMARVLLHGRIDSIQCSWVKLGDEGTVALLRGGANDLGGTLMEETISRMAGSEHGSARTVEQLHAIAAAAGRPARQRTTTYA